MTNAIDKAIGPVAAGMIAQFGTAATMQGGEVSSYDATTGAISQSVQEAEIKVIIGSSRQHYRDARCKRQFGVDGCEAFNARH